MMEAALINGRKPLLLVPHKTVKVLGTKVGIGWDGGAAVDISRTLVEYPGHLQSIEAITVEPSMYPRCAESARRRRSGMSLPSCAFAIEYLRNKRFSPDQQRYELDMLEKINREHAQRREFDSSLEDRIQAFELAFRMQAEAPEAFEVERESPATKKLYGLDQEHTRDFGWQCLLARRLVERGVRFVQCWHSYKWDQHSELVRLHTKSAHEVDVPIAGLLKDLKARGLLKDTLVLWGGEFGRTPKINPGAGRVRTDFTSIG
jgi:hypothetical protein